MADKSRIEWTEASWNPVVGCSRVSAGCDNCYAITMAHRIAAMHPSGPYPGTTRKSKNGVDWTGVVKTLDERLDQPLRWKRPRRIFVNSMSDLFHPTVPFDFIDQVFAVMALAPQHTFQVLTKRPERMAEYTNRPDMEGRIAETLHDMPIELDSVWQIATQRGRTPGRRYPYDNIWLGTSVENQATADERIPHLLRCPAAVRWLSCEPLLGPVLLDDGCNSWLTCDGRNRQSNEGECCESYAVHGDCFRGIDWLVVGGESGPKARPFNIAWARDLMGQCQAASVPCFMKQMGSFVVASQAELFNWSQPDSRIRGVAAHMKALRRLHLSGKGGDDSEWPRDLHVREYPTAHHEPTPSV